LCGGSSERARVAVRKQLLVYGSAESLRHRGSVWFPELAIFAYSPSRGCMLLKFPSSGYAANTKSKYKFQSIKDTKCQKAKKKPIL
jgi:hypothetical protein